MCCCRQLCSNSIKELRLLSRHRHRRRVLRSWTRSTNWTALSVFLSFFFSFSFGTCQIPRWRDVNSALLAPKQFYCGLIFPSEYFFHLIEITSSISERYFFFYLPFLKKSSWSALTAATPSTDSEFFEAWSSAADVIGPLQPQQQQSVNWSDGIYPTITGRQYTYILYKIEDGHDAFF